MDNPYDLNQVAKLNSQLNRLPKRYTLVVPERWTCNVCGETFVDRGDDWCPFCGDANIEEVLEGDDDDQASTC